MAEKKYVQKTIQIPNGSKYSRDEKIAIANEIVNYIRKRSKEGLDKNESPFPTYSKGYTASLDFKNVKGRSQKVNLTLSGDMLAAMDIISVNSNSITVGYDPSSSEADRAEGNIRGTYGQQTGSKKKARDFLGIKPEILKSIVERKFPLNNEKKREKNTDINLTAIEERDSLFDEE